LETSSLKKHAPPMKKRMCKGNRVNRVKNFRGKKRNRHVKGKGETGRTITAEGTLSAVRFCKRRRKKNEPYEAEGEPEHPRKKTVETRGGSTEAQVPGGKWKRMQVNGLKTPEEGGDFTRKKTGKSISNNQKTPKK